MEWKQLLSDKRYGHVSSKKTSDLRTEFQRDYHRIIGSASFRRLQDKTQVFPLDRGDFVRTRLTHSLEVASFAKSLGQMCFAYIMQNNLDESIDESIKADICNILECAGLLHDIGNPPFGHFGETAIREWFRNNLGKLSLDGIPLTERLTEQMQRDLCNFEGNAQVLRILTKLHYLVDENGMHLTYALLNTLIKYPVSSCGINKESGNIKDKKMGYYYAEKELFDTIVNTTGAVNCRYPLTFLLEAADDIAYKTADIEDAVKKGLITYDELLAELRSERYRGKCGGEQELKAYNEVVDGLETFRKRAAKNKTYEPEFNAVQNWLVSVQGFLLRCAMFGFTSNYKEIMAGTFGKEVIAVSYGKTLADALSDIAYRYAFNSKQIVRLEIAAGTMFEFLLDKFVPAAILHDTDRDMTAIDKRMIRIISDNYVQAYEVNSRDRDENEKLYLRLLLVTDYICGMTDGYAKHIYQEFKGIS